MLFSIAMSNYQRVSPTENNYFLFQASAPLSLRVETPRQPGCGNTKWWHQIELRKNYTMVQQKDKWRYYWAKKGCINEVTLDMWDIVRYYWDFGIQLSSKRGFTILCTRVRRVRLSPPESCCFSTSTAFLGSTRSIIRILSLSSWAINMLVYLTFASS